MSQAMNDAIEHVLDRAKAAKVDAEVLAVHSRSTGIAYQARKLEQFTFSETHQLGVRVLDGKHEGMAYTESLEPESLTQALSEALANARMIEREWISELVGARSLPELKGMYNASLEEVPVNAKIAAAESLEAAALDFDPAITSVAYTRYSDGSTTSWIANSKGLRGSYRQNYCMGYTFCLAKDGEASVMDGEFSMEHSFEKLDAAGIARKAAAQTLARRGAVRPQTGKYTVVFENRAAEKLIGLVTGYFSAREVDESTSPLKGRLGEKVFSEKLSLIDDPSYIQAPNCRPFDDEGFAAQATPLVENGVVRAFLTNSVLARKLKLPHTASAARSPSTDLDVASSNVLVRPGKTAFADLMKSAPQVILITDLKGTAGFRHTSGDFSIPMEGYLYQNGARTVPLKDFLVSGNILQMLNQVSEVGNDLVQPTGSVVSPSLLISEVNVSGKS